MSQPRGRGERRDLSRVRKRRGQEALFFIRNWWRRKPAQDGLRLLLDLFDEVLQHLPLIGHTLPRAIMLFDAFHDKVLLL